MSTLRVWFLGLLMLVVSVGESYAATFYVRTDGNDACNGTVDVGGSSGNCAKLTIQAGVNLAFAGDTVTIHTGNYSAANPTFTTARAGSSGNLITIQAATGETVSTARMTSTHDFIKIQGLRVITYGAFGTAGIQVNGNDNQVLSNTVLGICTGEAFGSCGAIESRGARTLIQFNTLDGQSQGENTSFTVGFYLHSLSTDNEVTDNLIKDVNGVGRVWELYGLRNHIARNEVRHCNWTNPATHPDLFQTFAVVTSRDHVIENNYFHDCDTQIANLEGNGLTGDSSNIRDITFRNNVFANITSTVFNHVPRIHWYNNTFYHSCTSGGLCILNNYEAGTGAIMNNAFVFCGSDITNGWYSGNVTLGADYNFVSNTATGGAKTGFSETHGINGTNPQLTTVANDCLATACDFHVGSTSALIDTGIDISGTGANLDKDGHLRPTGAAWDIGAYEFSIRGPSADGGLRFTGGVWF